MNWYMAAAFAAGFAAGVGAWGLWEAFEDWLKRRNGE